MLNKIFLSPVTLVIFLILGGALAWAWWSIPPSVVMVKTEVPLRTFLPEDVFGETNIPKDD